MAEEIITSLPSDVINNFSDQYPDRENQEFEDEDSDYPESPDVPIVTEFTRGKSFTLIIGKTVYHGDIYSLTHPERKKPS